MYRTSTHFTLRGTILGLLTLFALPALADSIDVELVAADGVKLMATYTSPGKPGPGVLLLHMCNSDRSAWEGLAWKLAARGIHSLALDYRGYGESGGERPEDESTNDLRETLWPADIDAAFEYLRSRPEVDKEHIGAAGGSCGVDHAVDLARRHFGAVKALALLAGSTDPAGEAFLSQNPWLPVLASASLDDNQAVAITRWTLGFSGHSANRFLEYKTGGHGTEMFAVHKDLEPAIAGWFLEHLIRNPVVKTAKVVRPEPGPSVQLWETFLAPGGVARVTEGLRQARSRGRNILLPPEAVINAEGYRQISAGEHERAIEVLLFNAEAFPKSANALDSLGDAYLAAGQPDKAAEYARQAIAAIPEDPGLNTDFAQAIRESAEGKLRQAED